MIVCGALVVAPTSTAFTPQDLAHKLVALDYGNGTAYAGLQMLEGAMPREAITTCAAATSPAERFAQLMRGDFEATVLQEPWITVAEKAGCRLVSTTFFHGTWVATDQVTAKAYAALLRAITRARRLTGAPGDTAVEGPCDGAAPAAERLPALLGAELVHRVVLGGEHDSIGLARGHERDLAILHVGEHLPRVALQRVAVARAPRD